jgi:hypothetical protein
MDYVQKRLSLEDCTQSLLALGSLYDAYRYAVDTSATVWEFAVSIDFLQRLGVCESELRWLVRRGLVEHGYETSNLDTQQRTFKKTEALVFGKRTCFVLSQQGLIELENLRSKECSSLLRQTKTISHCREVLLHTEPPIPNWDIVTKRLQFRGAVVKCFRWPAINQECLLNAFQEEGWPERIDDPLPPLEELDPKRRLADTIKCLNRNQSNPLLHFRGDGTGEGILWEVAITT